MINEADTCRKYVLPKPIASGWDNDPRSSTEQKTFTDGRIVLFGAKEYAAILDSKFAYETNGHGIVEFDFLTGQERQLETFRRRMNSGSTSV